MTYSLKKAIAACLTLAVLATGGTAFVAAPVQAQDFSEEAIRKANPYKDLPGVEDPQKAQPAEDKADCSQELQLRNYRYHDRRFSPQSGIVYRCERDGITVESSRPPLQKNWNPLAEQ